MSILSKAFVELGHELVKPGTHVMIPLIGIAQTPEPTDEHRVVGEGLREVDRPDEHLVVASRRDPVPLPDQPGLAPPRPRPASLEIQDGSRALVEGTHDVEPRRRHRRARRR